MSSESKRYRIKIYDKFGFSDEETKGFVAAFTRWQRKDVPGLGERLEDDQLLESDLFILKDWLEDIIAMNGTSHKFEPV